MEECSPSYFSCVAEAFVWQRFSSLPFTSRCPSFSYFIVGLVRPGAPLGSQKVSIPLPLHRLLHFALPLSFTSFYRCFQPQFPLQTSLLFHCCNSCGKIFLHLFFFKTLASFFNSHHTLFTTYLFLRVCVIFSLLKRCRQKFSSLCQME